MIRSPHLLGGVFGIEFSLSGSKPPFLKDRCDFYLNARSAMWKVLVALQPPAVWMPSYLCESMLDAPSLAGANVKFYPINRQLRVENGSWIHDVRAGDVVIAVDYFGFPCTDEVLIDLKARGAWILEDASQALLSTHVGGHADMVVYSPRKFVGVPDAGILHNINGPEIPFDPVLPPSDWWLKAFGACLLRRDYDLSSPSKDRAWFSLFKQMEKDMPVGNYAASPLSISLLESSIDWNLVAQKRRQNYQFLLSKLSAIALFKELPLDVVPLGFPIIHGERDRIRQALFSQNIYPPIHWELTDVVPGYFNDSHQISKEILTLICDQRYDLEDMERMITVVRGVVS